MHKNQIITLNADFIIPKGVVIPGLHSENSPVKDQITMFKKGVILQYTPQSSWNIARYRVFQVNSKGLTNEWQCNSRIFEYVWNAFRTEDLIKF